MLFVRRYVFPGIFALTAYLILSALFTLVQGYFLYGALFTLFLSYLIRIFDDICDYEKDLKKGKTLLNKKVLIILGSAVSAVILCVCVLLHLYFFLLPLFTISAQFLAKGKLRTILKVLFIPSILIALFHSVFEPTPLFLVPIGISVITDIAIIIRKVASDDTDE